MEIINTLKSCIFSACVTGSILSGACECTNPENAIDQNSSSDHWTTFKFMDKCLERGYYLIEAICREYGGSGSTNRQNFVQNFVRNTSIENRLQYKRSLIFAYISKNKHGERKKLRYERLLGTEIALDLYLVLGFSFEQASNVFSGIMSTAHELKLLSQEKNPVEVSLCLLNKRHSLNTVFSKIFDAAPLPSTALNVPLLDKAFIDRVALSRIGSLIINMLDEKIVGDNALEVASEKHRLLRSWINSRLGSAEDRAVNFLIPGYDSLLMGVGDLPNLQ